MYFFVCIYRRYWREISFKNITLSISHAFSLTPIYYLLSISFFSLFLGTFLINFLFLFSVLSFPFYYFLFLFFFILRSLFIFSFLLLLLHPIFLFLSSRFCLVTSDLISLHNVSTTLVFKKIGSLYLQGSRGKTLDYVVKFRTVLI